MLTVVQADRPSINRRSSTRSANRNGDRPAAIVTNASGSAASVQPTGSENCRAILVEEEHPILRPRLPNRQKHELPARPRMERVRHPNSSLITDRIERS